VKKEKNHTGVIEALAKNKTKWWQAFNDILMNHLQGQTVLTNVKIKFTHLRDKIYELEIIETGSSGVGMDKETLENKYYNTLTGEELLLDPSGGVGIHTIGVLHFTMKVTKKSGENNGADPELYSKGLETLTRLPHETEWINLNYNLVTHTNVSPPRKLTDKQAKEAGYPIDEIGTHGTYQKWPEINISEWGDNWFEELAQMIEFYMGTKLNFILEKHDSRLGPDLSIFKRECKQLVHPCVDSPYIDEWTSWKDVKIGKNTFRMKALLRPELQELQNGSNYIHVRSKYENRLWKHPFIKFGENGVLIVREKDTGVVLEVIPNVYKGGLRMRGTIVIEVDKRKVQTDITKTRIRFTSTNGKPFSDNNKKGWWDPIKKQFDEFFPHRKETENQVRDQLQDVLTGKQWPYHLVPMVYKGLCKDMNIKPYDYDYAKKHFMGIKLGDIEIDLYDTGNRYLYELKIKEPDKDLDYHQIKSYAFSIISNKNHELHDTKRIIMFANSDGKGFDNNTIEKFTTRLNDTQDEIEFVLLDLSDYGLHLLADKYKDAPKS